MNSRNLQESDETGARAAQDKRNAADKKKRKGADAKPKLVRESFSMPKDDFALIGQIKERLAAHQLVVKKSEILRAALRTLSALNDVRLFKALSAPAAGKTGRQPKKERDSTSV